MAVRVRIRIESLKGALAGTGVIETTALVNTGYEADDDELSVPEALAARLGIWPKLPAEARQVIVRSYTGRGTVHVVPAAFHVRVVEADLEGSAVVCAATIAPAENEALISDALTGSLELDILNARTGEWCFRGETRPRRSYPPDYW